MNHRELYQHLFTTLKDLENLTFNEDSRFSFTANGRDNNFFFRLLNNEQSNVGEIRYCKELKWNEKDRLAQTTEETIKSHRDQIDKELNNLSENHEVGILMAKAVIATLGEVPDASLAIQHCGILYSGGLSYVSIQVVIKLPPQLGGFINAVLNIRRLTSFEKRQRDVRARLKAAGLGSEVKIV